MPQFPQLSEGKSPWKPFSCCLITEVALQLWDPDWATHKALRDIFTVISQVFKLFYFLHLFLFFCFFYKFIYFIYSFLAVLGLRCCTWDFSSCGERGLHLVAVCGLLIEVASLVAEHRL